MELADTRRLIPGCMRDIYNIQSSKRRRTKTQKWENISTWVSCSVTSTKPTHILRLSSGHVSKKKKNRLQWLQALSGILSNESLDSAREEYTVTLSHWVGLGGVMRGKGARSRKAWRFFYSDAQVWGLQKMVLTAWKKTCGGVSHC